MASPPDGKFPDWLTAGSKVHEFLEQFQRHSYEVIEKRIYTTMMQEEEEKRFRSFAERYVIERASTFRSGEHELEDAWSCVERAKKAYGMIADQARVAFAQRAEYTAESASGQFRGKPLKELFTKEQEEYSRWLNNLNCQPEELEATKAKAQQYLPEALDRNLAILEAREALDRKQVRSRLLRKRSNQSF